MVENLEVYNEVICNILPANSEDAPILLNLAELTVNQLQILEEITSEPNAACHQWSIWDVESLEYLKCNSPEVYERFRPDLYSMVTDEKNCLYLDLMHHWGHVTSIFRGEMPMEQSICISKDDDFLRINLFSGKQVDPGNSDPFFCIRYQEVDEVLEMVKAFSEIDETEIRQRFEQSLRTQPPAYKFSWTEEFYPILLKYCQEVKEFYQTAANQNFGVINGIC